MASFDIASALGTVGLSYGAVQASDSSTSVQDLTEHQTGARAQPTKAGMLSGLSGGGAMWDAVLLLVLGMILLWVMGAGVFRSHNLG